MEKKIDTNHVTSHFSEEHKTDLKLRPTWNQLQRPWRTNVA